MDAIRGGLRQEYRDVVQNQAGGNYEQRRNDLEMVCQWDPGRKTSRRVYYVDQCCILLMGGARDLQCANLISFVKATKSRAAVGKESI